MPLTLVPVVLFVGLTLGACRTPMEPVRLGDPASSTAAAPLPPGGRETRVELTLGNGLRVVLEENHVSPVVAMQVWAAVGSADDAPAQAGVAHLFEHMLFKSTKRRAAGQIAREIDAAGGTFKAWTSFDQTTYQIVLASAYTDTGLDIFADALTSATFDPVELEAERKAVQIELKQAEESPERAASQALFHAAFSVHPYGRPVLGTAATVAALTRDQLVAAYQRSYVGRNLTLVVVGDFDGAQLKGKIKTLFASVPTGDAPSPRPAEPSPTAPRTVVMARDLAETRLLLGFRTPAITGEDLPALDLLSAVLGLDQGQGPGAGGRLEQRLVRSRQLLTRASSYTFASRDGGLLVISAAMLPGRLEEPARALLDEVLRLAHEELSPAELDAARTQLLAASVRDTETPAGYARQLGFFSAVAGDVARQEVYRTRLAALTPADLRAVAARTLRPATLASAALVSARGVTGGRGAVDAARLVTRLDAVWAAGEARAARRYAPVALADAGGDVVRVVLPSGVRLLVLRDPSAGLVDVQAVWPGGQRYEDARSNGISNLIATLLARGTKSRAGWQLAAELRAMPGAFTGFAARNSLGLRGEFPAAAWEHGLEILADCLANPQFADDELERERRVVLDEIRAQDRNPADLALQLFSSALWSRHPYRLPELGTTDAVASLSRRRLLDHYRRYYAISGLTIAIVGDVVPARVVAKLQSLLGDATGVASDAAVVPVEPARSEPIEVFRPSPAEDAHVVLGYPGTTLRDPDRYALEVLTEILSGPGGRLAAALRDQRPFVRGSMVTSFEGIDPGSLAISFACRPQDVDASVTAARAELGRVVERGVTASEVARARQYLVGAHAIALDRRSAIAAALAFNEAYGQGAREFRRYAEAITRITPADLQRVARKFIDPRREVVAVVRPEEDASPARHAQREAKSDSKSDSRSSSQPEPKPPAAALKTVGAVRSSAP